jgi:DNA-binding MarR family transcriptional regulator
MRAGGIFRRMAAVRERELVERWRDLLTTYNAVANALDQTLQREHGIGLSEFEALDRLIDAGDKCVLKVLGSDMYLSQSALSRAVDRLERQGLVARSMCDNDRRSIYVAPTATGRQRHADASSTRSRILADHLG